MSSQPQSRSRVAAASVSAMALHLTYALACAGVCTYLFVAVSLPIPVFVLVILLLALWLVATLAPDSLAPLALIAFAVIARLFAVIDGVQAEFDLSLLLLAALLPLTHCLAGLAAGIPARGKFEWLAIAPTVIRTGVTVVIVEVALLFLILTA